MQRPVARRDAVPTRRVELVQIGGDRFAQGGGLLLVEHGHGVTRCDDGDASAAGPWVAAAVDHRPVEALPTALPQVLGQVSDLGQRPSGAGASFFTCCC